MINYPPHRIHPGALATQTGLVRFASPVEFEKTIVRIIVKRTCYCTSPFHIHRSLSLDFEKLNGGNGEPVVGFVQRDRGFGCRLCRPPKRKEREQKCGRKAPHCFMQCVGFLKSKSALTLPNPEDENEQWKVRGLFPKSIRCTS